MIIDELKDWSNKFQMTNTKARENQTLDGVMNYLNLTRIGLKNALIARNGGNCGWPFSCNGTNRLLMMMMMNASQKENLQSATNRRPIPTIYDTRWQKQLNSAIFREHGTHSITVTVSPLKNVVSKFAPFNRSSYSWLLRSEPILCSNNIFLPRQSN